jgi:glycosyltransferase involved in cell wall biosynthesis
MSTPTEPTDAELVAAFAARRAHDGAAAADRPRVSVIIPAYNVAGLIGETLRSVFAQTFTDFEAIVVNDGSPDTEALERVLAPFREHITYIRQENRGLSGARNTAIRAARADLVALLDSDDLWTPDYLAVQVAELDARGAPDVLYCDAEVFGEGCAPGLRYMGLFPSRGPVTLGSLLRRESYVMVSVLARRATLEAAGLFDESLRSVEDWDMWLRVAGAGGRIEYHDRALVRYRRRPGSLSADPIWMLDNVLHVLDKTERTLPLTPDDLAALRGTRRRYLADLRVLEGKRALLLGDVPSARRLLGEANAAAANWKVAGTLAALRVVPNAVRSFLHRREPELLGFGRVRLTGR